MILDQIFIIGDKPGKKTDPTDPLGYRSARSGRTLAEHLGMNAREYTVHTQRINSVAEEKEMAGFLMRPLATGEPLVILGKAAMERMARRFSLSPNPPYGILDVSHVGGELNAYLYPHTSGVNRIWNDTVKKLGYMMALRQFVARHAPHLARQLV